MALVLALGFLGVTVREGLRPGQRHYQRGLDRMAANDPAGALHEWLEGIRADPKDPRCFEMAGDFYLQARRLSDAANFYNRATQLSPRDGGLFRKLTDTLGMLGLEREAIVPAKTAAELLPADADAQGHYGQLLKEAKRRPEALHYLQQAHRLRPEDRRYFLGMVDLIMETLQMDQAEQALRGWLAKHPDDPEASFRMAVVYNQKPRNPENLRDAIRYAERSLAGMPEDPRPYSVLGQLYLDSGRTQEALRLYLAGHHLAPTQEGILRGLADCYTRLGQTRELTLVSKEYQQVLKRHDRIDHLTHVMGFNNKDLDAGLELARLSEEEGLTRKAQQYYEQLLRQAPKEQRMRDALSGFYRRIGKPELASRALDPAFVP